MSLTFIIPWNLKTTYVLFEIAVDLAKEKCAYNSPVTDIVNK